MNCRISSFVTILGALAVSLTLSMSGARAETPLKFGWSSVMPHPAKFTTGTQRNLAVYDAQQGTIYVRTLSGTELASDLTIGLSGAIAACMDYDGDSLAELCTYDSSDGCWYAFMSAQDYQLAYIQTAIGLATTEAHPADYDGDGKADPALYDASLGLWVIYPSAAGYQPVSFSFGASGQTAVPMDYDGDGKADPALYDANNGQWGVLFSASQYALSGANLGGPGCVAAPADFDGDRKADPAVYYAPLGVWGTLKSANNYEWSVREQGGPGCVPVPDYYYFTNRADYAVYNTTNSCWYIAYNPVGDVGGSLGGSFFESIINGAGSEIGSEIMGWALRKIFHHGEDPYDAHWAEEQAMLSEMNQKLDELLVDQQVITNMLIQLTQQLEYDKNQIEWFITQGQANGAIAIIESHYDQHGVDGYASFYQCDTNNPPSCADVDVFVNIVLGSTYNMKTAVDNIYRAMIPAAGTTNGVFRLWAAMAKPTLTPDNLLDNFNALAYYFATMYNYQMKGAVIYLDASRVHGTSEWAKAATAAWITNDLVNMVQEEVDEFRAVTYDYVMTAINAAYNPASTNNPMTVTNIAEVLAPLEFFSRQWLAQTQSLCATFLTVNRPEIISNYTNVTAVNQNDGSIKTLQSVITNCVTSRTYGYADPDLQRITVRNDYVFLRNEFGQVPVGAYKFYNPAGYNFGTVTVTNYDENMNPTNDPTVTNWFGHLYASPYNLTQLTLPLDIAYWWSNRWDYVNYYAGTQPSHRDVWYAFANPDSITNFHMKALMYYDMRGGYHNPSGLGVWPWDYAMVYPFAISNRAAAAVTARAFFTVEDPQSYVARWDDYAAWNTEWWSWHDCGGFANFSGATSNIWTWQTGDRKQFPCGQTTPETHISATNRYEGMAQAVVSGTSTSTSLYIGGQLYLQEDCWEGAVSPGFVPCYVQGEVLFKVKKVVLSFY